MEPITRNEVLQAGNLLSAKAMQWAYNLDNLAYLNKPMNLFGSSQKVEKGSDKRETHILYLQPAGKVARHTLCTFADKAGCEEPCLISSGQLGMTTGQRAATKRTILLLLRPDWFNAQLLSEIDKAERKAKRTGVPALFRLNGTSDIDWSHIVGQRPASQFYDYTKVLGRVRANTMANYHLTFSGSMYSTQSKRALSKAVARGYHIAVAFNTKGLASDNVTIPDTLADFDETDLRPLDKVQGVIGALKRKGSNKIERALEGSQSFFVTQANMPEFADIIAVG